MKSTNKAGALRTLRMAPSYALPTREYAKLGDMMTYNSAANIQGLTEQFLFEEDRFEDIQALQILSTKMYQEGLG